MALPVARDLNGVPLDPGHNTRVLLAVLGIGVDSNQCRHIVVLHMAVVALTPRPPHLFWLLWLDVVHVKHINAQFPERLSEVLVNNIVDLG